MSRCCGQSGIAWFDRSGVQGNERVPIAAVSHVVRSVVDVVGVSCIERVPGEKSKNGASRGASSHVQGQKVLSSGMSKGKMHGVSQFRACPSKEACLVMRACPMM